MARCFGVPQRSIAIRINEIQQIVATLSAGNGYGYATSYDQIPHRTWWGVNEELLIRSEKRIDAAGVVDRIVVHKLREAAAGLKEYFAQVRPTPFLARVLARATQIRWGIAQRESYFSAVF